MTFLLADPSGETPEVDDTQIPVFYRLVRGMAPKRVCELLVQAAAKLPPLPPRDPDPALAALVGEHAKAIGAAAEPDAAAEAFYNALWQQAAAQGITAFVSAGDNGGAGCDDHPVRTARQRR